MVSPAETRIIVTGSRTWDDVETVAEALDRAVEQAPPGRVVIVHGACPTGADAIAAEYVRRSAGAAARLGKTLAEERWPAEWRLFGTAAGPRRNAEMVALGADLCLAFVAECAKPECTEPRPHGSHGASGCADLADAAGIPTRRFP